MRILRNKDFNIAITLSFLIHIVCIFGVGIIISQEATRSHDTHMAFLGSILDRVSVISEKAFPLENIDLVKRSRKTDYSVDADMFKDKDTYIDKLTSRSREKQSFEVVKDISDDLSLEASYFLKLPSRFTYKDETISGSARNRTLVGRPKLLNFNYPITNYGFNYKVIVKFNVAPDGTVHQPELVTSSGSPSIDEIAKKYIRKWIFTPIDKGTSYDEGSVNLAFSHY